MSPNTFDSRIGPKLEIVARTGTPMPPVPSDRNSTGYAAGDPVVAGVLGPAAVLSLATPGRDSPDRSPLMSAIITGTPAADSCSAITCSDFVLPVPVAPATRPCRLTVASGNADAGGRVDGAVDDDRPELERLALRRVAGGDLLGGRR